ncbi:MAG: DUF4177 domain-containing protein [Verrucomicrobiota bacterium]|nr:DUF4177 domain-containing protein [Verrucomicrobiota bacterium]
MSEPNIARWEYKVCKFEAGGFLGGKVDASSVEDQLNRLGMQGWEVAGVFETNLGHGATRDVAILLKRPVPNAS